MKVRFWGTRGSVPTPGPSTVRYGGNTSCIEVRTDGGTLLILDCGTGARTLGRHLTEEAGGGAPPAGAILIGHTHWDHIHGLPFFAPLFLEGSRWDVYAPRGLGQTLDRVLAGQMEYQYFPINLDEVSADVSYHDLLEGSFQVGDALIRTQYLNHPALTLGFRIEADGATVVYASDHEPYDPSVAVGASLQPGSADARHAEFLAGADLVVHDTQYDAASYAAKVGWGHSPMEYAVRVAASAGARRLVLFHHDPERDDDGVDDLLTRARSLAGSAEGDLEVDAAAEGREIEVRGDRRASAGPVGSLATERPAIHQLRVAVSIATRDPDLDEAVRAAASAEDLEVRPFDGDLSDCVVVLDVDDGPPPRFDDRVGVIGVTRVATTPSSSSDDITEWIMLPASIAHLRTKLRAAVLRRACRWMAAPVAPDEAHRLATLRALHVLDTPREARFDQLVELACRITETPIGLVTLVDAQRQWFKAAIGFDATETHRDESFCAHAILGPDVLQVPDTLLDPRFADNPAVAGPARVRFYAGAPLAMADGSRIGTLCVADHRPRLLDERQLAELRRLADRVIDELQAVRDPTVSASGDSSRR